MPFADSFIATAAVLLAAAGLLHCILPRSFRLGVILLLAADGLFALDIAFNRRTTAFLQLLGLEPDRLNAQPLLYGPALAVVILILCYLICVQLLRFTVFWQRRRPPETKPDTQEAAADDQQNSPENRKQD